jgi:tetratricopeptide (TPR) repeat protein
MVITQKNSSLPSLIPYVDLKKKKVLIVEDFSSFRSTVKRMLQAFGLMYIDEAADGEEAISKISKRKYDIIICDYNLGSGKDGQQVLEEARGRRHIDYSTVFIMATAENTMNMLMGALEYQPDAYLVKPFNREILERRLKEWVNKKDNLQDIEKAIEKKDHETVISLCDQIMKGNPKNMSQLLQLKGEALIMKGDHSEAGIFYEKVLTMGNLPWAALNLGKIRFFTGNYDAAREIFEGIIAQNDKIVFAHDWLAKVHQKMGNFQAAQEVLEKAVRISPKAILRQKALGDIAYKNKDLAVAEKSFREAVEQGKQSFFKSPSDFTSLAKVLVDKDKPEEGLSVLKNAGKEFTDNPDALLQITITEMQTLQKMNREEDARKVMEKVSKLSGELSGKPSSDTELDLAKTLILAGDEAGGNAIIRRLIQNNHEDEEFIANVGTVFKDLNIEDKGQEIIAMARDEVIILNNDGVRKVKEGDLDNAIDLFEKAMGRLPDNKVINANAAQAFMAFMKKNGSRPHLLKKTGECLDRVKQLDPSYKNLNVLVTRHKELEREA